MPILKTEIFGSVFEINHQDGEREKLEEIIKSFNTRLTEFKNLEGKVSDIKLLFLAALKAEDKVSDLTNQISLKEKESDINKIYLVDMTNLKKEVIKLKDDINKLTNENNSLKKLNSKVSDEIDLIENKVLSIIKNILDINKNDN